MTASMAYGLSNHPGGFIKVCGVGGEDTTPLIDQKDDSKKIDKAVINKNFNNEFLFSRVTAPLTLNPGLSVTVLTNQQKK